MLLVLSPAKTLDMSASSITSFTKSSFLKESKMLVALLKKYSSRQLQDLMSVSEKIADLNVNRFKDFKMPFTLENSKQALLAFQGDVYQGLGAEDFDEKELAFAQKTLRILSGLYGILKPLDLMQAYRLEMGTRLKNEAGKNLYDFWGTKITEALNAETDKVIVNLASNEYWKSVKPKVLDAEVYTIHFKEKRAEKYKVISFSAKKARGLMARYVIKEQIEEVTALKNFDWEGYKWEEALSSEQEWVFVR